MRFVKGISLFFIYPLCMLGIGFYAGVEAVHFFYPGQNTEIVKEQTAVLPGAGQKEAQVGEGSNVYNGGIVDEGGNAGIPQVQNQGLTADNSVEQGNVLGAKLQDNRLNSGGLPANEDAFQAVEAVNVAETLNADTEYVLEETDVLTQSVVETVSGLPAKYIGMDREQFLEAMKQYEAFPPLTEMERGFVSLEVLSFSQERVVVQMNYQYVQPSTSFYLAVQNNEVIVLLEDQKTIFINTGIRLEELPENVQMDIIQMRFVEDEEKLYNFLEAYSS